jgi:hypothetical protein
LFAAILRRVGRLRGPPEVRDAVRTYALTFWLRSSISMSMASFSVVSLIAMVPDNE